MPKAVSAFAWSSRYLLENGLEGLDGVLFLDERDERAGR